MERNPPIDLPAENLRHTARAYARGESWLAARPAVLYLEASDACDLHCPMCPLTLDMPRITDNDGHFDPGLIGRIEPVLPYVRRLFLSLGGEPLLSPSFHDLVTLGKAHRCEVLFNTHGMHLSRDISGFLVEQRVDSITFSVDAADPETYRRIRVGGDLETVQTNIRGLREVRDRAGAAAPQLIMQMTLMRQNAEQIIPVVEMAADLGIEHLAIEPLTQTFFNYRVYRKMYDSRKLAREDVADTLIEAQLRGAELGLAVTSHWLQPDPGEAKSCTQPWMTFIVKSNGEVRPCCGTDTVLGNLQTESFEEIWNAPTFRRLREQTARGDFPDYCTDCARENRTPGFNLELLPR